MKKIFIIAIALLLGIRMYAQDVYNNVDTTVVAPIESSRLQGYRQATEAEKEYARLLAEEREQQQIDRNLPLVDENGQAITNNDMYYPYWGYGWGFNTWRLHKGLNVNLSASVFANLGNGYGHGAGFVQDVSLMYVTNLSKKATLAVGGYVNHLTYRGDNYFVGGVNAVLGYQFNEHWSAYAFVQKAFTSDNFRNTFGYAGYGSPYWGGYGTWGYSSFGYGLAAYGYDPTGWDYGAGISRYMDRIGGGVTYQWGSHNQNSISVNVEFDHVPAQRNGCYNTGRYDYPVR